ncbi:MAG: hypothetical protein U9Q03_04800 [Patescibacteria group bacterium]|nr:hypothetical protein [Patescibacteria group bacterium]
MKRLAFLLLSLVLMGSSCIFDRSIEPPTEYPGAIPPPMTTNDAGQLQMFDAAGNPLADNVVRKEHNIGTSSCPDPLGPLSVNFPPGFEGASIPPSTDAAWLDLPPSVTPGEPFDLAFNCNISDFTNHKEVGQVNFDFNSYAQDHPGLEHLGGTEKGGTFFVVMDTCNGPCVADFDLPYICASDCESVDYVRFMEGQKNE